MTTWIIIGAVLLGLGAAHRREREAASAGGVDPRTKAALRRLPPHLRAKAIAKIKAKSAGISSGTWDASTERRASAGRAGIQSRPMPWMPRDVDAACFEFMDQGVTSLPALTKAVLREVYPVTPAGREIPWPTVPGDGAALRMIEERVRIRCLRHLAAYEDMKADEHG